MSDRELPIEDAFIPETQDNDDDEIDPVESFRRGWADVQEGRVMTYDEMKLALHRDD